MIREEIKVMNKGKKWDVGCVIYDCDGVLFDSFDANSRLYNHIAISIGREALSDDELHFCHTHTVYESIAHIFRGDMQREKQALDFLKDHIDFKDFIIYLRMEPHLVDTLERLKARGIFRAISTNRTTSMRHIMERYGLWPYFDVVVTARHAVKPGTDGSHEREIIQANSKPDPEGVGKILDALKVDRDATVYIGDSEVDMGTAKSSGVKFIAYKNDGLEADGSINDHLDLLDFLSNG